MTSWNWFETFLLMILLLNAISDFSMHLIRNRYVVVGLLIVLMQQFSVNGFKTVIISLIIFVSVILVMSPLYLFGGFGAGDLKIYALIAAYAGPSEFLYLLFYILILGAIYAGLKWAFSGSGKGTRLVVPMGIPTYVCMLVLSGGGV